MRALGYTKAHPLDQFDIQEVEVKKPELKPLDLLIQIKAVSVNPVDTKNNIKLKKFKFDNKTTSKIKSFE